MRGDANMTIIKKILYVLLLITATIICFVYMGIYGVKSNKLSLYSRLSEKVTVLPSADEINSFSNVEYFRFKRNFIFESEAHTLKITCDNYDEDIQRLNEKYHFEEEPVADKQGNTISSQFSIKYKEYLYEFQMLNNSVYNMSYPNEFILLGSCDELKQIVYIYFSDSDLDCIDNIENFISLYCGWA